MEWSGSLLDELLEKLIGDKAYDSDLLDRHLDAEYRIEMVAPKRENRTKTQGGGALRRYLRRWVVGAVRLAALVQHSWLSTRKFTLQLPRHGPAWPHKCSCTIVKTELVASA